MPLLQQTHPGAVRNPNLSPDSESVPVAARPLGAVAVAEGVLGQDGQQLPWLSPRVFEPYGNEREEYVHDLLGDGLHVDSARPWVYREEVKNTVGLDMNLLAIAQRKSDRVGLSKDSAERDFQERRNRVYVFSISRDSALAPSRHTPAVMVTNGLYLAEVEEARAAGKEIPEPGRGTRIVEYGSAVRLGDESDNFKVQVTKDGGVVISDHGKHGTEVIAAKGRKRANAFILGGTKRPNPTPPPHPLDGELTWAERATATPTDPWGQTTLLPIIRPRDPHGAHKS